MTQFPVLAITVGEPAGIGPEISLRAAWQKRHDCRPILIGDIDFLRNLARQIDVMIALASFDLDCAPPQNVLEVLHIPLSCPVIPGKLNAGNGLAVLATLDAAIDGAIQRRFDAIVTAPLQKSTINDAGIPFSGHTEYLAEKTNTKRVVMMLACEKNSQLTTPLRVALATTHLPLRAVSDAITLDDLSRTLDIIHADLQTKFGIADPTILVTGLNPHAGENGYLGDEEIKIITPAIEAAKARGFDVRGPYPADTVFQPRHLDLADCVLAMYHDQGLPVLKYASFSNGVNITLGLPIIRTSVDHGTALDLAERGVGHAQIGSMLEAMQVAITMSKTKKV